MAIEPRDIFGMLLDVGSRPQVLDQALRDALADQRREVVYFAERDGFVKIGTTADLGARVKSLNRGDSAVDGMTISAVNVLAVMHGGRPVERSIHRTFQALRYAGEWFLFDDPLVGFVRAVAAASGTADARTKELLDRAHRQALVAVPSGRPRGDVLADVIAYWPGDTPGLHWPALARIMREALPAFYGDVTGESMSALLRGQGVPSVDVKRHGKVMKGCRRDAIEVARREGNLR